MDDKPNYSYIGQINICKLSELFKYNITYPVLKSDDKYDSKIISNINDKIYKDAMEFKDSVKKQATEYKKIDEENLSIYQANFKYQYEVYINNDVTYNRSGIISIVVTQYEFTGGAHGMTYLKTYNYNLLNGKILKLKDLFKEGTDYKKIVNNVIIEKINKNPEQYFKGDEGFKGINENQDFYIDNDGVVIYFGLYEIAPYYVGIPKFKLKFSEFDKYLNYN